MEIFRLAKRTNGQGQDNQIKSDKNYDDANGEMPEREEKLFTKSKK